MASPFTLNPNPIFKSIVSIPRHDDEDGKLTFHFKHRPVEEFTKMTDGYAKRALSCKTDAKLFDLMVEHLMDIAAGWALPEPFTKENVRTLIMNYSQAYSAITDAYRVDLIAGRVKN